MASRDAQGEEATGRLGSRVAQGEGAIGGGGAVPADAPCRSLSVLALSLGSISGLHKLQMRASSGAARACIGQRRVVSGQLSRSNNLLCGRTTAPRAPGRCASVYVPLAVHCSSSFSTITLRIRAIPINQQVWHASQT